MDDYRFGFATNHLKLNKGDKLRLVLYTTDFEHTIRDNSDYELTVDLSQSQMTLPY